MFMVEDFAESRIAEGIRRRFHIPAFRVFGPYDVVADLSAENYEEIAAMSLKIRAMPGVLSTTTFSVVYGKSRMNSHPYAFALLNCLHQKSEEEIVATTDALFALEEVTKADSVLGIYDIVLEICTKTPEELSELLNQIKQTHGVRTMTMIVHP